MSELDVLQELKRVKEENEKLQKELAMPLILVENCYIANKQAMKNLSDLVSTMQTKQPTFKLRMDNCYIGE